MTTKGGAQEAAAEPEEEYVEEQNQDAGPQTYPSGATVDADRADAAEPHRADREPTDDEAKLAEKNKLDPEVERNMDEAIERGANVKGEGQIDPDGPPPEPSPDDRLRGNG